MNENLWVPETSLAIIVGNRYTLFRELYPDREVSLGDLADKTDIDIGNLSRYITEWESRGLIITREAKSGRGKPLRLIRLTNAGINIIRSYIELAGTKPRQLENANPEDLDFYMKMIDDPNSDIQQMAATEITSLCEDYSVIYNDRILPFLKDRISSPHYQNIRFYLLQTLLNVARNSTVDQIQERINPIFTDMLTSLLSKPPDDSQEDEKTIRTTIMEILTLTSEGAEGFKELVKILTNLIEKKDILYERAQELILYKYPQNRSELRRALFKLLTNQDRDVVRRTKEQIERFRVRTSLERERTP